VPDKPPSDDEFKSRVYSFVLEEPRKRSAEELRHRDLVNGIEALKGEVRSGFEGMDQRVKGVEARVDRLEQGRKLSPLPGPVSLPPARLKVDTGNWEKKSKAEAEVYLEQRAREIAEEAIADGKTADDAKAWRSGVGLALKVALLFVAALLTLGSGFALSQCTRPARAALANSH
jgi:hypothetical protein